MQKITEYYYGMRLRGASPGAQPKKGMRRICDKATFEDGALYHDVVAYSRVLTEEECEQYDLDFLEAKVVPKC